MHAERVVLLPWRLDDEQGQPDHNGASSSCSGGGEQRADRPERVVQGNAGVILVGAAVRGRAVHQGGVLPFRGRARPVGPRLGAPLQHAQLRGGGGGGRHVRDGRRVGLVVRPVARNHLVPGRGLRVAQQRERPGNHGVDRGDRAGRVPHHP